MPGGTTLFYILWNGDKSCEFHILSGRRFYQVGARAENILAPFEDSQILHGQKTSKHLLSEWNLLSVSFCLQLVSKGWSLLLHLVLLQFSWQEAELLIQYSSYHSAQQQGAKELANGASKGRAPNLKIRTTSVEHQKILDDGQIHRRVSKPLPSPSLLPLQNPFSSPPNFQEFSNSELAALFWVYPTNAGNPHRSC